MSPTEKVGFATTNLTAAIGAVFKASVDTLLSGTVASEIRELLDERGVVLFPEVNLTDEQQIAFTKTLGVYKPEPGSKDGVFKVTMDPKSVGYAFYNQASFYWYIDGTMNDVPILASILSARSLSPTGGETEFANAYAAYEALSESDKRAIDSLKVVHSFEAIARHINPEPSYAEFKEWQTHSSKTLPLVWTHHSGRKSLILGSTAHYVAEMNPADSADLLIRLRDHATQPQFVYRHRWKLGDMVLWDNTGTMHRALRYPFDSGRLMHRTKLEGEEAFA
jgi:alpha-ketoglutarate-dependent taurine dioxygenase